MTSRQNSRHFSDNTFTHIFLNENNWIFNDISLQFIPKDPIDNTPALVQITAWNQTGDEPLSELMVAYYTDTYMPPSASMDTYVGPEGHHCSCKCPGT